MAADLDLPADEVIKKAKARGVTQSESTIRHLVYNIRSELKKKAAKPSSASSRLLSTPKSTLPTKPATTAAKPTASAKLASPVRKPSTSAKLATPPRAAADLTHVLANVARVNEVIVASGGVERARETIEAVQACGGVKAFLQHLDLVATIKSDKSSA